MSNGSFEDYYKQLIGWTITAYREEEDEFGDDPTPIFTLTKPRFAPLEMVILRDPEGNGAGFADFYHPKSELEKKWEEYKNA
jgi:catechol-2,3-dioxygenase|tara:strand:+ start:293 stop:538 length:246 start_codon:yes stop_codon:yes gene_type:complete